jgi:hypothetical protein
MDYPNRTRLKLLGRVELVDPTDMTRLTELEVADYRARVERGFVIHVEAFDWNCPQHITPRYTAAHIEELMAPLREENRALEAGRARGDDARPVVLGEGPLDLVVSGVRQLTPRIRAYELRAPGGSELPAVEAGAHLRLPVRLENGEDAIRHYSICSNPERRDIYEIAVLRDEQGTGGSCAVHAMFDLGLRLRCELPRNHFPLHYDMRPALLIAGGIGITPIKAMAQALKARGNVMHLHYAGRSGPEMAFRDRLTREFGSALTVYRSADGGRMEIERILATAPDDALIYVCGPGRLIEGVIRHASRLGIDAKRIRVERFVTTVSADAKLIQLELRRSGMVLRVARDQSILDALLAAGIDAPFGCRNGSCRTCVVKVLGGEPEHRDSVLSTSDREEQQLMCPCVSRARSDRLALDI